LNFDFFLAPIGNDKKNVLSQKKKIFNKENKGSHENVRVKKKK